MGHLGHLKEEYVELVERLEAGQIAFPRPKNPVAEQGWQEVLEILYSPEEARLAAKMPVKPASLRRVAGRFGLSTEETERKLEVMADRGIVMDLVNPKTGKVLWMLSPPVVGFIEFSLMRAEGQDDIPKKKMARALDAYLHGDDAFAREAFGGDTVIGRAMVREAALDEAQLPEVLEWERATAILDDAWRIAVSLCYCRHEKEHVGQRCEAPMENCFSLNLGADFVVRRRFGREIDKVEALALLDEAREHGLVQIADNIANKPMFLCNCCGCCCGQLTAINEFDLRAVNPSSFEAEFQLDLCKGCSKCAKACPIGAITMVPTRVAGQRKARLVPHLDRERCIGCGVCAEACNRRNVKMTPRSERPYVPRTAIERTLRMAIERGHLPHLLVDQGSSRGARFLNQALQAICSLPRAQQLVASEQLKSRFVRFVLGTGKDPAGERARR
jgi:ferredoxin